MRAIGSQFISATPLIFQQVSEEKPTFRKTLTILAPITQSIIYWYQWKEGLSDYLQYNFGPAHFSGRGMGALGSQATRIPRQTVTCSS